MLLLCYYYYYYYYYGVKVSGRKLPGALMGRLRGLNEGDPMTDVSDDSDVKDDRADAAVVACVTAEEVEDAGAMVTEGGRML